MAIATYKTRAGAQWYANELAKAHPGCTFEVVPGNDWNFHVKVTTADGRTALAERRPANFGKRTNGSCSRNSQSDTMK